MSQVPTVFDYPVWQLRHHPVEEMYANVSNKVKVDSPTSAEGADSVLIAIPTQLFSYLKDVEKVTIEDKVSLYLDYDRDGNQPCWIFGFRVFSEDGYRYTDLWTYTDSQLPDFIRRAIGS